MAEPIAQDPTNKEGRLWLGIGLLLMAFVGFQYHSIKLARAEARTAVLAECNAQECEIAVDHHFDPCFDANFKSGLSVVLNSTGMLECLSDKGIQLALGAR